ncbi:MAG: Secretion system C-terminal sorting domain, partial [Bacteroidota bacterium]
LFPNPIEDTARLEFTSSFLGSTCQVFSFSGQLMGEFKVDQTNMSLDCTTYAPGNYFLSATSSEGTISRTFVVK